MSDQDVTLSQNKLWVILIVVWLMSCMTSAGVSWYFAGVSSDRSNDALAKIVAIQRTQGTNGLNILYTSAQKRCLVSVGARQMWIHDARIQAAHEGPSVIIPPPLTPCAKTVIDPNGNVPHAR